MFVFSPSISTFTYFYAAMVTEKFSKLPELAKPLVYEIRLAPCLKTFKVKGQTKICLEVRFEILFFDVFPIVKITKATKFLKLHADRLELESVSLRLENGTGLVIKHINSIQISMQKNLNFLLVIKNMNNEVDQKSQMLTVNFPDEIAPQRAELDFVFNGEICTQLSGFYRFLIDISIRQACQ